MEGVEPSGPVASELVAMFCFEVLPTLQRHFLPENPTPAQVNAFKKLCKAHAKKLGLRPEQWPLVTLPCFISLDWDPRHTWLRKVLAVPRITGARLRATRNEALDAALQGSSQAQAAANVAAAAGTARDAAQRGGFSNALKRQREQVEPDLKERLAAYIEKHKVDPELLALWEMALVKPELWITLIPHQFMPLSKVSPDMHCVVEHMVGTIKRTVKKDLLEGDLYSKDLWKGRTYQVALKTAVEEKGCGTDGLLHIEGSVGKQPLICEILAAEEDEELTLKYVFGKKHAGGAGIRKGKKRKTSHKVFGTAGHWIRMSKWG